MPADPSNMIESHQITRPGGEFGEKERERGEKSYCNVVGIIAGAELTDTIEGEVEKQIEKCLIGLYAANYKELFACTVVIFFLMFVLF